MSDKEKDNLKALAYILKSLGFRVKLVEEDDSGIVVTVDPCLEPVRSSVEESRSPRMIN